MGGQVGQQACHGCRRGTRAKEQSVAALDAEKAFIEKQLCSEGTHHTHARVQLEGVPQLERVRAALRNKHRRWRQAVRRDLLAERAVAGGAVGARPDLCVHPSEEGADTRQPPLSPRGQRRLDRGGVSRRRRRRRHRSRSSGRMTRKRAMVCRNLSRPLAFLLSSCCAQADALANAFLAHETTQFGRAWTPKSPTDRMQGTLMPDSEANTPET